MSFGWFGGAAEAQLQAVAGADQTLDLDTPDNGIASSEAFGTARIDHVVESTGIATSESFGSARVDENITGQPIASGEVFGTLRADITIEAPAGIASAEALGAASVFPTIDPSAIASAEAFGSHALTTGPVDVTASGIASTEAFGGARLDLVINSSSIATQETFGAARIDLTLAPGALASAEAFGTARVDENVTAPSIASTEAFGGARVDETVQPSGVTSAEAFGTQTVAHEQTISGAGGIASAESWPLLSPILLPIDLLSPASVVSGELFGSLRIDETVQQVVSAVTGEAFGAIQVVAEPAKFLLCLAASPHLRASHPPASMRSCKAPESRAVGFSAFRLSSSHLAAIRHCLSQGLALLKRLPQCWSCHGRSSRQGASPQL